MKDAKSQEGDKRETEQQLKESEEFFRSITEQSLLGLIIIQDGILKYVNDITLNYSGYSRDEVINLPENELLKFIHHEDGDKFKKALIDPTPKMTFRLITKEKIITAMFELKKIGWFRREVLEVIMKEVERDE